MIEATKKCHLSQQEGGLIMKGTQVINWRIFFKLLQRTPKFMLGKESLFFWANPAKFAAIPFPKKSLLINTPPYIPVNTKGLLLIDKKKKGTGPLITASSSTLSPPHLAQFSRSHFRLLEPPCMYAHSRKKK